MTLDDAVKKSIIRITAGSHLVGLNTPASDEDVLGVCIEDLKDAYGLSGGFEQVALTAPDITIYSLRKFLSLALKGNPTVLGILFAPPQSLIQRTSVGQVLQELAPKIVSQRAGYAFLGYLQAQRSKMAHSLGDVGMNRGRGKPRQDLIDAYGFDTKFAMHALRLGYQGIELLDTGRLTLPISEPHRTFLMRVRNGEIPYQTVTEELLAIEAVLQRLLETSHLPPNPDTPFVERWMLHTYWQHWNARMTHEDREWMRQAFPNSLIPETGPLTADLPRVRESI